MSDEISDSLLQEVAACQEISQWSEMTAQTEESTADQNHGTEGASGAEESLVPSAESLVPIPEHRIPETEAELETLPNPLRQLIATAGVKLVAVPCGTWHFDGYAAKLPQPLSVTFSVDAVVSSEDVFEAVCNAGVAAEEIRSIQYRGLNRSWCVSFVSRATKDRLLERGVIQLGGAMVFIGDDDLRPLL